MNGKRITMVAIDLAKETFQVHGIDEKGKAVVRKTMDRERLAIFMQNLPHCTVAMEACAGSNYWSQRFVEMGHTPKLIAAQFVKAFLKSQKNDRNDAEAIAEAAQRPSMRFVAPKQRWQQDVQTVHRIRERLLRSKVSLSNQARGILLEYGITIKEGVAAFKEQVPKILEEANNELSPSIREALKDVFEEFKTIEGKKEKYDKMLEDLSEHLECKRLKAVPGVGPLVSTAFYSAVGDPNHFKNGRQVAAWLGLVPKQFSTGGKTRLGRITKRGDCYLRSLIVHGARASVTSIQKRRGSDPLSQRVLRLIETGGVNKAVIAVANRNARVMWALLKTKTDYQVAFM